MPSAWVGGCEVAATTRSPDSATAAARRSAPSA